MQISEDTEIVEAHYYGMATETIRYVSYINKNTRRISRLDGPAIIGYYQNNTISIELWAVDGKHHRLDGPAVIRYTKEGKKSIYDWYVDGKLHRLGGPAVEYTQAPLNNKYYIHGIEYTKEQYDEYFRNLGDLEQQELLVDLSQSFE